jgi:hypothetical protein
MRVLVCPLDWGLGHATRCIPLIRALLGNGHQVRIGAGGGGLALLRAEFPGLDVFEFPGYRVRYSRSPALFLPIMLAQLPRLLLASVAESRRLRRILKGHPCDLILSDGRYGVRSASVPSIFVTHQLFIRVPGRFAGTALAERLILALNLSLLRRFTRVWVPDYPGDRSLSGELSHKPCDLGNLEFIGPLARFPSPAEDRSGFARAESAGGNGAVSFPQVDALAVVSGPEPQRSLFEAALRKELGRMSGTRVLVRGLPGSGSGPIGLGAIREGGLTEFAHLPGGELAELFRSAGIVIVRSGYTTVMELAALGARNVVMVPTPGQSEQEYLADHLDASGAVVKMDQGALDLGSAGERLRDRNGFAAWMREDTVTGKDQAFSLARFLADHPVFRGGIAKNGSSPVQKAAHI